MATGWLQVFGKAGDEPSSASPHVSPPLNWASRLLHSGPYIFCRKKIVENTFFI